jgi:site-specific DNA-cytosine methylase
MRELKPRTDGVSNTITTLLKDNYVAEPIIYDDYNSRISADQDAINTLTCNCGAAAERNGVKIIEPIVCEERKDEGIRLFKDGCVGTLRTIDACGDKRVLEPEEIKWRIRKLMPVECWKLMAFSREDHNRAAQYVSNSALYKQAGNSIVVNVLVALMSSLFVADGHKAEVWTKYALNPNE